MKSPNILTSSYLILLSILLLPQLAYNYTISGNVLTDLISTDGNFMAEAAASGWTATSFVTSGVVTSPCNAAFLVGGWNILGPSTGSSNGQSFYATYSGLPSHTHIDFSFKIWIIDEWIGSMGDKFAVKFDTQTIQGFVFDYTTTGVLPNECGINDRIDLPSVTIEGRVVHNSSPNDEVTFSVISLLRRSSYYQSFGIREIKLTFITLATTPANSMCARASKRLFNTANKCACPAGQYESIADSGTCSDCVANCIACPSAGATCTSCKAGYFVNAGQCAQCTSPCAACNAAGTNACTACIEGRYISGSSCPTCTGNCATCSPPGNVCLTCLTGFYKVGTTCQPCHSSCATATCSGGGINQCLTCPTGSLLVNNNTCVLESECASPLIQSSDGVKKFCDSPCPGNFAYWDSTCTTTCSNPPFLPRIVGGTLKLCTDPCPTSPFLYVDGGCLNTCDAPYTATAVKGKGYCNYTCESDDFLYFNRSCLSSCPLPLVTRTLNARKYCDYPCTTGEYLYWDSICRTECPKPLEVYVSGGVTYCNFPCASNEFARYNGTCSSQCNSPLTQRIEGTGMNERKYCDLVCGSGKFMYWNGLCRTYCDSPLLQTTWNSKPYCTGPCGKDLPYYFPDLGECGKDCPAPRWIDNSAFYVQCSLPVAEDQGGKLFYYLLNAPIRDGDYTLVVLVKQMQYVRYLKMDMPPRLYKMATSRGRGFISLAFGPSMSSSMKADFFKSPSLPTEFERYGLHSSFLVNFWEDLMTLLIVGLLIIVFTVLERVFRGSVWKTVHGIFERLAIISRFNGILLMFGIYGGDIILFTAIEFRTFSSAFFSSSTVSTSLFMGILCLVLTVAFYGFALWMIRNTRKNKGYLLQERDKETVAKHLVKWRGVQLFFRGFKSNVTWNQYFFVMYLLRINLPMFLSAWLLEYPLVQTILNVFLNTGILVYILAKKPLEEKVNHVQIVLLESIILVANCCVLFAAILDAGSMGLAGVNAVVGDIIIICNDLVNALLVVFMIIKCKILADRLTELLKVSLSRGYEVWVQLLAVPLQQAGMGFEQLFEEGCMSENSMRYTGLTNDARPIVSQKAEKIRNKSQIYPLIDEDPMAFTNRKGTMETDYAHKKNNHFYQNSMMDRSAAGDVTTYPLGESMLRSPSKLPQSEVFRGSPVRASMNNKQMMLDSPQRLPQGSPLQRPAQRPMQRSPQGSPQQLESPRRDIQVGTPGRDRIKKKLPSKVTPLDADIEEIHGSGELPNTSALVINEAAMSRDKPKSHSRRQIHPYDDNAGPTTPIDFTHEDTLNSRKPNSRQRLAYRNQNSNRHSGKIYPSEFDLDHEQI